MSEHKIAIDFDIFTIVRNLLEPDEFSHLFSTIIDISSKFFPSFKSGIIVQKEEKYILTSAHPVKEWIHFPLTIKEDFSYLPTDCFFKKIELDLPEIGKESYLLYPLQIDLRENLSIEGWFLISADILKDKELRSKLFFTVDILREAVKNIIRMEKIKALTIIDEVTGLFNTRHLFSVLDQAVIHSSRYYTEFALIFLDIDHFKNVNDSNNHLIGSQLLKKIGEVMLEALRKVDLVFRYGGDEFVVFLPHTPKRNSRLVVERIRDKIRNHTYKIDGVELKITASFGVACFPEDGSTVKELIEKADKAMYLVKKSTRDGIEIA